MAQLIRRNETGINWPGYVIVIARSRPSDALHHDLAVFLHFFHPFLLSFVFISSATFTKSQLKWTMTIFTIQYNTTNFGHKIKEI